MYGPVIQGKLVSLRPPRPDDAPLMITWFEDMEITRFLALRHPPNLEYEKEWLDKTARDPNSVIWVVEHGGAVVGVTGIHEINWKFGYGTTGTIIGDKRQWGKGLARELMQLRARYAFTELPLRKLKSQYYDGNVASGKAQAAAGYQVVGRARKEAFIGGQWVDAIMTEVLREDWEMANPV
ncbi:MAG: GNAT family N-acetyltransferase [Chloroflexi bacterium]|nr:MAG: GNAT family N-acetyltransferase [Chloroflexota bacterium]